MINGLRGALALAALCAALVPAPAMAVFTYYYSLDLKGTGHKVGDGKSADTTYDFLFTDASVDFFYSGSVPPAIPTGSYGSTGGLATLASSSTGISFNFYAGQLGLSGSGNACFPNGALGSFVYPGCGSVNYEVRSSDNAITFSGAVTAIRVSKSGDDIPLLGPPPSSSAIVTSFVPEPATWAMMLIGFGAIGYTMRRRPVTAPRHLKER